MRYASRSGSTGLMETMSPQQGSMAQTHSGSTGEGKVENKKVLLLFVVICNCSPIVCGRVCDGTRAAVTVAWCASLRTVSDSVPFCQGI